MDSNYEQEISAENETQIVREFFPELLEASEWNENMERGRGRGRSMSSVYGSASSRYTRRPAMAGNSGRRSFFRRQKRIRRDGYGYAGDSDPTAGGAQQQDLSWAQGCLSQILGPWVRQTGRWDFTTKRAIRIFQSRSRLQVTGSLDRATRAAMRQACGQSADTPAAATVDSGSPAAMPAPDPGPGPDFAPDQDQPPPQDGTPPTDGAPPQHEYFRRQTMLGHDWTRSA